MIRKLSFCFALMLLSITIAQAMDVVVTPTSVDERTKVFEQYYLENPENKDTSVFAHMSKWHEEDFRSLEPTVYQVANKERLYTIHIALQQQFESGTISFTKIALTYLLYSYVSASEQHSKRTSQEIDTAIRLVREYFEKSGIAGYISDLTDFQKYDHDKFGRLGKIISLNGHNLHWMPYVSETGLASLRTLNNLMAMRAPTLGVPLTKIASFDGNLDATQDSCADHEVNHGGFYDSETPELVPAIYTHYHRANRVVRNISDAKTQVLCDFFLYTLGHERGFGVHRDHTTSLVNSTAFKAYDTLEEACDYALRDTQETFLRNCQSLPLDYYWPILNISSWRIGDAAVRVTQSHDEYYATTSVLSSFVTPGSNQLYSLVDIINVKGLSKKGPLQRRDIREPFLPNLRSTFELSPIARAEFHDYEYELGLRSYNILMGDKEFFNENGFAFEIWEGEQYQTERMSEFFQMVCNTFKREVGPHMKVLDWEVRSTK